MVRTYPAMAGAEMSIDDTHDLVATFEALAPGQARHPDSLPIPCRLLRPDPLEPGRLYPLVVFLHGAGERGSDNTAQLAYLPTWMATPPYRQDYPCFLLAPQCPRGHGWIDVERSGDRWRMSREMSDRLAAVADVMDRLLAELPVDPARQYLTGISMGGFGSWDLGIRLPARFAAVAPICGGGDPARVASLVGTPLWCAHGDRDDIVPPQHSREMIAALRAAGGAPIYTELKGVGHDSWTPTYRDERFLTWLFEQRRTR